MKNQAQGNFNARSALPGTAFSMNAPILGPNYEKEFVNQGIITGNPATGNLGQATKRNKDSHLLPQLASNYAPNNNDGWWLTGPRISNAQAFSNRGFGESTSLSHDAVTYRDKTVESVEPMIYQLNPIQSYRPDACISPFGPTGTKNSPAIALPVANQPSTQQQVVDVESALRGQYVKASRDKMAGYTQINVDQYINPVECSNALASIDSLLQLPKSFTRGQPMSRFHDPIVDPLANIYWDRGINTTLQARDNYVPDLDDTNSFVAKGNTAMVNWRQKVIAANNAKKLVVMVPTVGKRVGKYEKVKQ